METYKSVIELIKDNLDSINFGEFGKGASDFWINKAQDRLNVKFPPSFIWWLKNYSGGEVHGEEIFSVYELDFAVRILSLLLLTAELQLKLENKKYGYIWLYRYNCIKR